MVLVLVWPTYCPLPKSSDVVPEVGRSVRGRQLKPAWISQQGVPEGGGLDELGVQATTHKSV